MDYDKRFEYLRPANFPMTRRYEVESWDQDWEEVENWRRPPDHRARALRIAFNVPADNSAYIARPWTAVPVQGCVHFAPRSRPHSPCPNNLPRPASPSLV